MPKIEVEEGLLGGKLPFMAIGRGEPLVFIPTVEPRSGNLQGIARWAELRTLKTYAARYKVYVVGRDPRRNRYTNMFDYTHQYAEAINATFGVPVYVLGISTGGSLALALAIEHPEVVKKLVLLATACRLGPMGKKAQHASFSFLKQGDPGRAAAALAPLITRNPTWLYAAGRFTG
jgi:pimeloyl-ACP methyl ester carboxylesterase